MFSSHTRTHHHHHHHPFRHFKEWWNEKVNPTIDDLTEALPEFVSYPIGVTLTDLQGVNGLAAVTLPQAGSLAIAMGWNYFDGINSILSGVNLVLDDRDYRKTKYFQGVLDILSGTQALALTYCPPLTTALGIGPLSLAGPVFAFMMLCDLINSAIDFYYPAKELKFKGWLHERVKEVNFILNKTLKNQLEVFEIEHSEKVYREKYQRKLLKLKYKIDQLTAKRDQILKDIAARSRVYLDGVDESEFKKHAEVYNRINSIIFNSADPNLHMDINQPPSEEDFARDAEIVKRLRESFKKHRLNLIIKGLSFSGMLLLAIAPFTGPAAPFLAIPGLTIVTFVAGYYLYKHRHKIEHVVKEIKDHVSVTMHSIFHNPHKKREYIQSEEMYVSTRPCP